MSKLKVAEIFYSLQGEGRYVGVPSVFLRTFGCNFQCRGFGMKQGETNEPEAIAEEFKRHPEWRYEDLPLAKTGCDSYASWHPAFKSLSPTLEIPQVVSEIEEARFSGGHGLISNNGSVHLVITGGEPLLGWQRAYPELFEEVKKRGYTDITFETNGTQAIIDEFADYLLREQITNNDAIKLTFSVSPKLPSSGERIDHALKPEIVASYQQFGKVYLKFVVTDHTDLQDVTIFVRDYRDAGFTGDVYLMPCGGVSELYQFNSKEVAKLAMRMGYIYSPRLQVDIWKNEWGT